MQKYPLLSNKPRDFEYLRAILRAPVYEIAKITSLQKMEKLSLRFNNTILVKREDQQLVHSFKIRGAYTMITSLNMKKKLRYVITASAGNHAQGVAFSAKKLGIKSIIIMPLSTSEIKVNAVKSFGAKVILYGKNFDDAKQKAIILSQKKGYTFIPPFDHPEIIAGQGTIALELLKQNRHIDRIFVPVGGGGLVAGIAILVKQLIPKIKVIAVEFKDSACLKAALRAGKPIDLSYVNLFAEGVAVKRIGDETFRICKNYIDDIISVDIDAICTSIKDLFEDIRVIPEPSGALALAGIKKYIKKNNVQNEILVNILSGANFNFHSLRYISERCELGENREALFAITLSEVPGSFLKFCNFLGGRIITEFNYRYCNINHARIFIGIQLSGLNERFEIINLLRNNGYYILDLSNDEISKIHIRHMIGGIRTENLKEQLYSFMFSETKDELLQFLTHVGNNWNITLFHYRNYGTNYNQILVGFEIDKNISKFEEYLNKLGYIFNNVTLNPAFHFFF